jgi:hypothetical protein
MDHRVKPGDDAEVMSRKPYHPFAARKRNRPSPRTQWLIVPPYELWPLNFRKGYLFDSNEPIHAP